MCGISGFNWSDRRKAQLMTQALAHRGPDASGVFTDKGISLGHNRLSVIDLSPAANQPMTDNTGEVLVVFNGEIYNFQELKRELEDKYEFKTKSDTEVLLAGYRKWGSEIVSKLNGMFAFAIWDKRDGSLLCARDQAGIKPFYYFWDGQKFIFASEMKAIFAHDIPRTLHRDSFNRYLRVLYVPEPFTMIENIFKLPPGHTLLFKDGGLSIKDYRRYPENMLRIPYPEAASLLREKVMASVKRHLVADVPVGVYLSGGIDSSAVLFSMSQFRKNVQTFSIGFELGEGEEGKKFNYDFELARRTARCFGSEHHPIIISAKDVLRSFEDLSVSLDEPISNPTAIPMMLLAKFARKNVTVVLTGSGGDELFGGYDRYRFALAAYYYKKLPGFVRAIGNMHPMIAKLHYGRNADLFARFMFEKDNKLSRIVAPPAFKSDSGVKAYFDERYFTRSIGDSAQCFMNVDQESWLPDYFFMLSDKMSMAHALEERVPLVDKELVAFARSIPRSYKIDLFRTKKILKDAFRDDLPDFLFDQPKRGWFSPGAKWLRQTDFSAFAREVLSSHYHEDTKDLFMWHELEEMLEAHIDKREYNLTILWAILTFQLWARRYQVKL